MKSKKHIVQLTPKERKTLISMVTKGRNKATIIRRAYILFKTDEAKPDAEISEIMSVYQTPSPTMVRLSRSVK